MYDCMIYILYYILVSLVVCRRSSPSIKCKMGLKLKPVLNDRLSLSQSIGPYFVQRVSCRKSHYFVVVSLCTDFHTDVRH
jgi:hypothetical protein